MHSAAIGGCVRKQDELSLLALFLQLSLQNMQNKNRVCSINFVTWLEFMIGINWMLIYPIQEKKIRISFPHASVIKRWRYDSQMCCVCCQLNLCFVLLSKLIPIRPRL